jgi:hypothetical protein
MITIYMKTKNFLYISETSIPSKSANIINSLKFSDEFAKNYKINFYLPNIKLSEKEIKKRFSLKNKFFFVSVLGKNISNSFLRFKFSLKVLYKVLNSNVKPDIILSRSVICSLLLASLNKKNILEIHHDIRGFTKILFHILVKLYFKKNIIFVVLNHKLALDLKITNLKYLILDDAADIQNLKKRNKKIYENTCVYVGSFFKGKGIKLIHNLSKIAPELKFHIYGDLSTLDKNYVKILTRPNVKFMGFINYAQVKHVLKRYHIALMPYDKKIMGRSSNLEISKYISPLKMFDYLSAGNIIFASNLKVFSHILKHNVNSFILNNTNIYEWRNSINKVFNNLDNFKYIKFNSIRYSKKYSWENRSIKLLKYLNSN